MYQIFHAAYLLYSIFKNLQLYSQSSSRAYDVCIITLEYYFLFLGDSLGCFSGQNILHNTNSDDESANPVRLLTCSSGQGCGTVNYHVSYYDITLRRHSFSVNERICANRDICDSLTYCLTFRSVMARR